MVGAGEEGVALGQTVKAQRAHHHRPENGGPEGAGGGLIAPYQRIDHQTRRQHCSAGEASAGGEVAVEKDVDAEQQDHRDQSPAHPGHNGIGGVVHHLLGQGAALFGGEIHENGHGAHGGEQHKGLTQRIESTVV